MIRTISVVVAALLPMLAIAQVQALKAAEGASQTSDAGNLRIEKAADAALAPDSGPGAGGRGLAGLAAGRRPPSRGLRRHRRPGAWLGAAARHLYGASR